jgi:DNA processing protein
MDRTEKLVPPGDTLAWLALALVPGLTSARAWKLVERFGTPCAVLDAGAEQLVAAGVSERVATAVQMAGPQAVRERDRIDAAGASLVVWSDARYPALLRKISDPPLALVMRGTLEPGDALAVAVVGARRATEYGRRVAEELAGGFAHAGLTVVSGLAAGIDAAAHRAALAAGGRTLAVLGTGIDRVYPAWHAPLASEIVRQGALLTEFACGTPPLAHHFPQRNRVLSGLTLGTVVVEAAERSGSLITARYASEEGREVFAVPGPVGVSAHRGPHRLIREGATLVTCVEEVLAEIAPQLIARVAEARAAVAERGLTSAERRILDALGTEGRHLDDVIHHVGVPAGGALETLLALELRGLVRQLPGKRFRRAA